MKKKMLIALSALFVFGLFGAVFALSGAASATTEKTEVSCPMHKQMTDTATTSGDHKDSCCGMADCCKDGKCSMGGACCKSKDACPMKKNAGEQTTLIADTSKVTVVTDGDSCCQPGADCCKGGAACCHKKS